MSRRLTYEYTYRYQTASAAVFRYVARQRNTRRYFSIPLRDYRKLDSPQRIEVAVLRIHEKEEEA